MMCTGMAMSCATNATATSLLHSDFGAGDRFAAKALKTALFEFNYTVFGGVNSKVAGHKCAGAAALSHTNLTHNYIAGFNLLAAKYLNTQALAGAVVYILAGT